MEIIMMKERLFFNMVNFIEIEISSLCNRKCLYCVQPMAQRKRELLPVEIVGKIADELKQVDFNGGIAFHQYNEPLLEKEHLFKCIRIIKENLPKAKLVLYTNGDLLTYKLFKQLIKLGIDEFHISCHGDESREWDKAQALMDVKQMKRRIRHFWGKWDITDEKVAFLPSVFRELVFKNKMYNFIRLRRYPYIVYIDSTNYFEKGSRRLEKIERVKIDTDVTKATSYSCQSMMHSMHISYKGNAYLCWDCCEGLEEAKKYKLGSIYDETIYELFAKKYGFIKKYMFEEEMPVCKKCFWNR